MSGGASAGMRHVILGTAGHIDHGKTALVHALTGIDPTRFPEERDRGMTIDIGFAYLDLPDGSRLGIIDVPGHERFVRNMLAGSAGTDLVLLVVDVNEGVMPQTREHLDIINLLGVETGCVALTKIDTADPEYVEIVSSEVMDLLADTALAGAPLMPVSAVTGEGLDAMKATLADLAAQARGKSDAGLCRLPVDRVFTMKGHGTVVTGTLASGTLRVNDELIALPSGVATRVRQLQSHGEAVDVVHAGSRVAANCGAVATEDLARGETLVRPGTAEATGFFNARVSVLPQAVHSLRHRTKVKCYLGTASAVATPILIEGDEYAPGMTGFVQLRLDRPLLALRGDRFILRTGSPEITIGGGELLDPRPAKIRRRTQVNLDALAALVGGDHARAAGQWLADAPQGIGEAALARRLGIPLDALSPLLADAGDAVRLDAHPEAVWTHATVLTAALTRLEEIVSTYFADHPTRMSMPREEARTAVAARHGRALTDAALARAVEAGTLEDEAGGVRLAGRTVELPPKLAQLKDRVLKLYGDAGPAPPLITHLADELGAQRDDVDTVLAALQEEGVLLRASGTLAYPREQWQRIAGAIAGHFEDHDTLAVADLKDLLGISRKHAMPILEYADATGLTIRRGDVRIRRA